jgi:hypothetical protein
LGTKAKVLADFFFLGDLEVDTTSSAARLFGTIYGAQ